jgi:transposase-like protein
LCRRHGMTAPLRAVGDGALGFWNALREVFPDTGEQRCWFHYADVRVMPTPVVSSLVAGVAGVPKSAWRRSAGKSFSLISRWACRYIAVCRCARVRARAR